jgi:hypothetical protein
MCVLPTLVTQKSEQKSIEKQVDEIFEIRTITIILVLPASLTLSKIARQIKNVTSRN